ncbi:MAG: Xaa-Pro peptidase family protein [Clostridiales bacterium]|nr:Xaa-Pro peptidase family protein [Clostridiales bacterium]
MITADMFDNKGKFGAYVFTGESNRFYFTRCETSFGAVIIAPEAKVFITDFRYESEVREKVADFEIVISTFDEFYGKIAETLKKLGAKTVGYEDTMSVGEFGLLKAALKDYKLKPANDIIEAKRAVKTEEEIGFIIAAQRIAEHALFKAISAAKPGMTERELMAEINYEMIKGGAEKYSFETITAFGANTAQPHHHPSDKKLDKDELILVDMGAKYNGYCSDMTRTFCLGDPGEELLRVYETVKEAQEYAIKYIKAGMTCNDADALAREYINANGYGDKFGHSFGHGVGIDIHESPRVGSGSDIVLQPNMVITAEPGIYIPGLGGVRIEDMLVVGEDGVTNITEYDKELSI